MARRHMARIAGAGALLGMAIEVAAAAVPCRTSGPFDVWLDRFEQEAAAQGISRGAIAAAAPYLVYDQRIVNIDRGQRIFAQSFLEFSGKMLPAYRRRRWEAKSFKEKKLELNWHLQPR